MAFSILQSPGASCLHRITMLLALDPSLEAFLINRQGENPRLAEQSSKRLHYLGRGGEDNRVHGFRFALASVHIEINPLTVRAEYKHFFLWQNIGWRHACLRNQIRTALAARAQV